MDFWNNIPRSAKWDVLQDERHAYLWQRALKDSTTGVERIDNDYILYGSEEALLLRPKLAVMKIGMTLYDTMLRVFERI